MLVHVINLSPEFCFDDHDGSSGSASGLGRNRDSKRYIGRAAITAER